MDERGERVGDACKRSNSSSGGKEDGRVEEGEEEKGKEEGISGEGRESTEGKGVGDGQKGRYE